MLSELLVALGQAWMRWLIFPGGLSALGLAWLLGISRRPRPLLPATRPEILTLLPSLLLISLLPLPGARSWPYALDLLVAIGLLELARLAQPTRTPQLGWRSVLLIVALSAIGFGAGSLRLETIRESLDGAAPAQMIALGIGGLALLAAGWQSSAPTRLELGLRRTGYSLLAALPLIGLFV